MSLPKSEESKRTSICFYFNGDELVIDYMDEGLENSRMITYNQNNYKRRNESSKPLGSS